MVPIDGRRMRYVGQSTKITVTKFEVSIFIRSRDRSREPKLKKWVTWYNAVGPLRLVQQGCDWAGYGPAQFSPRCTKCNSPPINGQCTNHRIAVLWSVALTF